MNTNVKNVELLCDTFGVMENEVGEQTQIKRFTWKNTQRVQVQVITYGATITSIKYPNKKGIVDDVVLGFDDVRGYINNFYFNFGSTLGRYASYIKNSQFNIARKEYKLSPNFETHHFNGGFKGFDRVVWNHHQLGNKVTMSYLSLDNEEGYPGDVMAFVTFELTTANEFKIEYKAMSTKPTIINLANHTYFNLAGHSTGDDEIKKHKIQINADCHTITDTDMLPTGGIQSVLNTCYDLQSPTCLGSIIKNLDGFNKNFCVNKGTEQGVGFVARLSHPSSGRILEIYSNQPGVNFDTANNLPIRLEHKVDEKVAKSPYIKTNVTTFDLLDEIYNRIADIMAKDEKHNYREILNVVQDLQKKETSLVRTNPATKNFLVKRSALVLDELDQINLTTLQKKYIEKIVRIINKLDASENLLEVKYLLDRATVGNDSELADTLTMKKGPEDMKSIKCIRGKKGAKYSKHFGLCLQTQNYPDAINNPNFPSCLLKPGQTYTHLLTYKFWVSSDQSGITGII